MMRHDYARYIRYSLTDPAKLCHALGIDKGADRQLGGGLIVRCPAHNERTPSCSVTRGPDGTIRVRCFGCGFTGDALTLIATCHGLDLSTDFREVLLTSAQLGGLRSIADEIETGVTDPTRHRRVPQAPAPIPEKPYPPANEVRELWEGSGSVEWDREASGYLVSRRICPIAATERGLLRVLGDETALPSWAAYRGSHSRSYSWAESGHRMLTRVFDSRGVCRSVRAWQIVPTKGFPKRLPPGGFKASGLVLANRDAVRMLRGDRAPRKVIVAEGEPDFLTHATTRDGAVLGVLSGSWSNEFAKRIPDDSEVVIRTHNDLAGDKYAEQIIKSLGERVAIWRSQPWQ